MSILGIVFSNLNDNNLSELTHVRTMGSVPFGGRYRLIDFVLSNMVNSGVNKVGVVTKNNYQSLMDHVGSGKEWDLSRKSGGLIILPPYGGVDSDKLYTSRLEALKTVTNFLGRSKEEYVAMSDCDVVYNLDFSEVIKQHEELGSDITLVYREAVARDDKQLIVLNVNEAQRVTDIAINPKVKGVVKAFPKIMVLKRQLLQDLVNDATAHGDNDFMKDVLIKNLKTLTISGYKYEGYFAHISSLLSYYENSMALLDKENRDELFNKPNFSIYTKVKDSPPTMYGNDAVVKNSFIADGCIINGTVENSIIFRGTNIGKGAVVKNSIIMQDSVIGIKADINCVITDKNVVIKEKRVLAGCDIQPFYIGKSRMV